jgi:molecular chaperone GrpE
MDPVTDTEQPAADKIPPSSEPQPNLSQTTAASIADGDATAEQTTATSSNLEDQLEAAERQAQENHERFLRAAAELDNFRKRKEREASDLRKYANQTLLKDLLGVVDNLERALAAARGSGKPEGLAEGVEMTLKDLLKIFDQFGVTPIESLQQPFDPNLHEAVMQEPNDGVPPNTVIQELQKGYLLHDRLLRPAMVVVSKDST